MPVRFQVDPDFYDHPKTLGMSDAAFALWTRAGSYSVAKLLDGFVPDDALSLFSQSQQEAAPELVRRGLWKRTRGGFRFHQWDVRNLTRTRIDAEREYERERKQRQRQNARQNENPQVRGHNVPPGQPPGQSRDIAGTPGGTPNRSVSVSVSESVSSPPNPQRGNRGKGRGSDDDPDFTAFWSAYPLKKDKGHARKAWRAALKRGVDPEHIIKAAQGYRDDPARKPDYTAYPGTWLNGERYNDPDEPAEPSGPAGGWWDN